MSEDTESLILGLPADIIYLVFSYCDVKSLGRLARSCKQFNLIISHDCLWIKRSKAALVTNQLCTEIKDRSFYVLSAKEKCRISKNWICNRSIANYLVDQKSRYMPWMQMSSDRLWYSRGQEILCNVRLAEGGIGHRPLYTVRHLDDDISRFVKRDGVLVSASRDGHICGWYEDSGTNLFHARRVRRGKGTPADIVAVDYRDNKLVAGSTCRSLFVWSPLSNSNAMLDIDVKDRVCAVAISPEGRTFVCGTAGYSQWSPPLQLYDLETGKNLRSFNWEHRLGAGVLDIRYENAYNLLTCGYDTCVRMWDTRTCSAVIEWEDPHDSTVYCMMSDQSYTVMSGTSHSGQVRLWDKRKNKCVQMYYVGNTNSPVYSLTFDPTFMYVALDRFVCMLDFTGNSTSNYHKYL